MSEKKGQQLSGLDTFSFVSGIIGLVADVVGLSTIFISVQGTQQPSIIVWIVAALLIIYTILIISIYTRRFLVIR